LNPFYYPSYTVSECLEYLRASYTWANLEASPDFLLCGGGIWIPKIEALGVPENLLYLLFYGSFFHLHGNRFGFYLPPHLRLYNNTFQAQEYYCQYDQEHLITQLKALDASVRELEITKGTSGVNTIWAMQSSPFYVLLGKYALGHKIFTTGNDGRAFDPESAKTALSSPDIRLKVTSEEGRYVYCSLKATISNKNRKPLYKIFPHSASPITELEDVVDTKRDSGVRYGVELEVSTDLSIKELIDAQHELFFIGKSDSSITGTKKTRVELVTVPLTYKEQRTSWAKFFKGIEYSEFDTSNTTNNGMHVHVSRKAFGKEVKKPNLFTKHTPHMLRFCWMITNPANAPFFLAISERDKQSLQQWAPMPNFSKFKSTKKALCYALLEAGRIRGAVNVGTDKPTVEVRLFKGIVSLATVFKNLDVVDALFYYTKDASLEKLTVNDFLSYIDELPANKYLCLRHFLKKIPIDEYIDFSRLVTLTFGEERPEKICEIVNSSGMALKQAHIKQLNTLRTDVTFEMQKGGLLRVSDKDKGKVAFLDRFVEANICGNRGAA